MQLLCKLDVFVVVRMIVFTFTAAVVARLLPAVIFSFLLANRAMQVDERIITLMKDEDKKNQVRILLVARIVARIVARQ